MSMEKERLKQKFLLLLKMHRDNVSIKQEVYESTYKVIENNFNSKFFDFNYSQKDTDKELYYYKVLKLYLSDKGYGYIASQINTFINKKNIDKIEVAKLLMDCNLIKKYNQSMKSSIENKTVIEYLKKDGLRTSKNGKVKSITIEYEVNIPFKIVNVVYSNIDVISHKCGQKNIVIDINIDENKSVNFTEIISIYTPYGVDKLEFTVKCKDYTHNEIGVENIEEYLQLCRDNPKEAKIIFDKLKFESWLIEKDYKAQILNYKQAKILKQSKIFTNEFIAFCILNGIYIETKQDKNNVNNEVIEEKIINNNFTSDKIIEKIDNKEKENNDDSCTKKISREQDDSSREEKIGNPEKGIFLGIKKKLSSIFKGK